MAKKNKNKHGQGIVYVILILLALFSLFPFFWLIRSSFMSSMEIFAMPMQWLPKRLRFENYKEALTALPFASYFKNTIFIVIMNMIGCILSSSFIAFGFSRIRFRGRNLWFALLLTTMMIPNSTVLIPQFIGWKFAGAYNTYWPLILPAFFGNAFFVFLLRQFNYTIPKAYEEAAFLDGGNYFTVYRKIILPLSKPSLTAVGVFTFMYNWNDFFGPLIYLNTSEKYTLALGLQSFIGQYNSEWHLLMAASTVIIVPMIIMFFFAQRYFIEGITFSGLKG